MSKNFRKKIGAFAISGTLLMGTFMTGFAYPGNIYSETISEIFNGTLYFEQIGGHNSLGVERSFFTTSNFENSTLKPYVFEGEVTGKYTLNSMMKYIEDQGYKVVSGINGDLYDTASGASKGVSIHEGLIKTSGYAPEYAISFDRNGKASLVNTNLSYTVKGTMNVPTTTQVPVTTGTVEEIGDEVEEQPVEMKEEIVYVQQPYYKTIGFVNIPHGAGKALHMYNRQYGSSTKSTQNCVEIVIDTASATDAQPRVGGTITGKVVGGKTYTKATPIADHQIILSAAMDSPYAKELAQLAPGTTIEITVDNNGSPALNDSLEALGVYYVLYQNGQYVTPGTNVNPRTCIGIKPDGTTMILALDGRRPGWSGGLGLTETAEYLVSLGCSTVVNMDGGGSTMIASRLPGKEAKATVKNTPSEGSQRAVTNGLFFVYKGNGNGQMENIHTYVSNPVAMPGADVQLSTFATDDKYEPAQLRGGANYTVEGDKGTVNSSGLFTAGSSTGVATISAEVDGKTTLTKIDIYDNITFNLNESKLFLDPGKTADINVTPYRGYVPVAGKDSLFTFTCDSNIGSIDKDGVFKAVNQGGQSGKITVSYKNQMKEIPVQVGASVVQFNDTKNHWANEFIGKLAARGILNGMGNNLFQPEGSVTRAQFLTMLAKSVYNADVTQSPSAGFKDVPSGEWYYNYVNWGFANGIVSGMDETTFAPNANISREQMAIMLSNFAKSQQFDLPDTGATINFTDGTNIGEWAQESVDKVVKAGILSGFPDGTFVPKGSATRAQAAKVIYMICEIKDKVVE